MSTVVSIGADLREKFFEWTITAMLQSRIPSALTTRVNVIKKVKVNGQWKFCPAIIESSGRLKDRVRSNGHTEIHPEGVYYIEWRENGQRRRQAVPNRNEVLEQARLKAFEFESVRMGRPTAPVRSTDASPTLPARMPAMPLPLGPTKITSAAGVILQGIEAYLQGLIGSVVQAHLAGPGANGNAPALPSSNASPIDLLLWDRPTPGSRAFKGVMNP